MQNITVVDLVPFVVFVLAKSFFWQCPQALYSRVTLTYALLDSKSTLDQGFSSLSRVIKFADAQ